MGGGTVVLYPFPLGVGHIKPFIQLANLFASHGVASVVAIVDLPDIPNSLSSSLPRLSAANPSVAFMVVRPAFALDRHQEPWLAVLKAIPAFNAALLDALRSVVDLRSLVLDTFSTDAVDVAGDLNVPAYLFHPSSASSLASYLHLPTLHSVIKESFKDMGRTLIQFPGVPALPASHMPPVMQDREGDWYKAFLHNFYRMRDAKGILLNSFESLEPNAVRAIQHGLCIPDAPTPSLYCIGPLVASENKQSKAEKQRHECLAWLDGQPERSVVFLCFGSMNVIPFSAHQLRQMAFGIENSGQRFLWVVQAPNDGSDAIALLPEGFLERTKELGMVVRDWAPQVDVLGHTAIGVFVTHCGWNSVLEGLSVGAPMLCWPLYAEQRMNKVLMVQEMGIGVELKGYDEGLVAAGEIESKIRWVLDSDEGKEFGARMATVKEKAAEARKAGGRSRAAFAEFLRELNIVGE